MPTSITCFSPGGVATSHALDTVLTPEVRERARGDAHAWIKRLRLVRYDGEPMRDRFRYRGDSLWWFTEIYLHKLRRLERAVAVARGLEALIEAGAPARLATDAVDQTTRDAAAAVGRARGIAVELTSPGRREPSATRASLAIGLTTRLSRLRPPRRTAIPRGATRVAAFVHTAFWREHAADHADREAYIGPVLDATAARLDEAGRLALVGVGPRRNFRARRWWDPVAAPGARSIWPVERLAPLAAVRGSLALWREREALADALVSGAEVRAAAVFDGCDLWPVLERELRAAALLQWPWSARAMDEAGAALDALAPEVVVTYAEAGGWGRALVLEARRRGVRSVGVQHGFIYRHWLNYRHEPDEMEAHGEDRGFPRPDLTLLFDGYARAFLERDGHFPAAALTVTGSARLDALAAAREAIAPADRLAARRLAGATGDRPLGLFAAKFTEVRDLLPAFARAVASRPRLHVAIKTHPAETPDLYAPFTRAVPNLTVLPAATSLAALLAAADGVITRNSTVAIDAMALGLPALVVGLPSNLTPFVEAGAMAGAGEGEHDMAAGLERLLYDLTVRKALLVRAAAFVNRYGMRPTGRAAERAADAILRGVSAPPT